MGIQDENWGQLYLKDVSRRGAQIPAVIAILQRPVQVFHVNRRFLRFAHVVARLLNEQHILGLARDMGKGRLSVNMQFNSCGINQSRKQATKLHNCRQVKLTFCPLSNKAKKKISSKFVGQ